MSGTYNPLLVFVSFIVAFLASYTAVELSSRISLLPQARRRTSWLLGGSIAMGIGIWSMHFIGMLAFALPIPVGYDLSTTAASLLIAVVVSFLALMTVTRGKLSRARLCTAGTLMGFGIAGMHYTGMAAMEMSPPIRYTLWIVMASVAIAIAASIAALWIAFTLRTPDQHNLVSKRLGSAMIMGLAITGMHYTGMGAANFQAGSICLAADKLDANWLALLVSTSSLTVLIGTLVFLGFNTSSLSSSLKRANDELRQRGAELERAIQSLRLRTDELARSNQALEQFAYVASHDLQEPLRAVAGPLRLLQRRYEGQLDARAHEYIGHAVEGALRMEALIDDLLTYSRVGRKEDLFQLTECDEALNDALKNLRMAIQESGAQVSRTALPTVRAVSAQLSLLFQNLLSNAIKFRRKDSPVHIQIGAEAQGHEWRFHVADDGIGIDPQYFERIFLIFQRLHTRRDYPGTGIGLALCKRIVEHHGGRIWVTSEPGRGTTFFFTLPNQAPMARHDDSQPERAHR